MVHVYIMEAIEKTLKDWGVDWKLNDFAGLMEELELAIGKVLD